MDEVLCDELLQEIFNHVFSSSSSSSSSSSLPLVSKRWLHVYRSSKTSLSLSLPPQNSTIQTLSILLSNYPSLSSLSLLLSSHHSPSKPFSHQLLSLISLHCSNLKTLKFLAGPLSIPSLLSLSSSCRHVTSLTIALSRPLFFNWVVNFQSLRELSVFADSRDSFDGESSGFNDVCDGNGIGLDLELGLESLCLSGIRNDDLGLGFLYRGCKKLKKLKLKSCEGIGDGGSYSSFVMCLRVLREVELRTCRSVVDIVLLKLAENCQTLDSLLLYDGGSRDGLLHFMTNSRCNLRKLDLRLPLDFKNDHLFALSRNFRSLSSLRLQSSCLVTGEGLKAFAIAMSHELEELALVNCDIVESQPGLLATLGQHLRRLRKVDLSYNETLPDKELISMLASCGGLVDLRLRGCKRLTNEAVLSISRSLKSLESIDFMHCCGLEAKAVEMFVLNSPRLRRMEVEESKLSDVARSRASHRFIEVIA